MPFMPSIVYSSSHICFKLLFAPAFVFNFNSLTFSVGKGQTPWTPAAIVKTFLSLKGEAGRWVNLPATK